MADSIKGRTEKGRRRSALNKLTIPTKSAAGGSILVSPNNKNEGRRARDRFNTGDANRAQASFARQKGGISTARGPNAAIQSPKKPKAPKRGSFSLGLPKTRK